MSDLKARLLAALGDAYDIERELGGGGMSRVFLAQEKALGRQVVIKVLPPDMAADVNRERFEREIRLAAQLQHPHIVPLLTAGKTATSDQASDLLFYIMPYIEGESLRAKLEREGELPVGEAVQILREVVDALAYAHDAEVVHRDIKPDNVMLTRGHAVVTDFGVAKAVSASSSDSASAITSVGVALGTPAYMSPEQAAADPHVDHRADIYAIGALAYEMLAGRPPFVKQTPQQILAAHVSEEPAPVSTLRDSVAVPLADLVMRCLAKRAADRWQSAGDLRSQLTAIATPEGGGVTPTATVPTAAVPKDGGLATFVDTPAKVAMVYGAASGFMLLFAYAFMIAVGLPGWVFTAAIALLVIGLPIVLATSHREKRRLAARTTGLHVATPVGLEKHLTWSRSLLGGGVAFSGLAVIAAGFMATRSMGIGPAATLVSSGVLVGQEEIILAEFEDRTSDSALALAVTEAMRIDLGQSPTVEIIAGDRISETMERMGLPAVTDVTFNVAREIAVREGIKAIVSGEINALGSGYVLSVRLVTTEDGSEQIALRETAANDDEIIPAVDRLSARLREQIGESLRTIRATQPLLDATTSSLEALELYSQGRRVLDEAGDIEESSRLLERALAFDSTFASAWRALSVNLGNSGAPASRVAEAAARAFQFRDGLPPLERYLVEAYYYSNTVADRQKAIDAYEAMLDIDPTNGTALNNLAVNYQLLRQYDVAAEYADRLNVLPPAPVYMINRMGTRAMTGDSVGADSIMNLMIERFPDSPLAMWMAGAAIAKPVTYDSAAVWFSQHLQRHINDYGAARLARWAVAAIAETQGRIGDAAQAIDDLMRQADANAEASDYLVASADRASLEIRLRGNPQAARRLVDEALDKYPLEELDPLDRPYAALAEVYALIGNGARAKALLDGFGREVPESFQNNRHRHIGARGIVAMQEGRVTDAVAAFSEQVERPAALFEIAQSVCNPCGRYALAGALDASGMTDSAIVVLDAAIAEMNFWRVAEDRFGLAAAYRRLGEIYEERGDRQRAIQRYNDFVNLWANADAELQPQVTDVRNRIARLLGEG